MFSGQIKILSHPLGFSIYIIQQHKVSLTLVNSAMDLWVQRTTLASLVITLVYFSNNYSWPAHTGVNRQDTLAIPNEKAARGKAGKAAESPRLTGKKAAARACCMHTWRDAIRRLLFRTAVPGGGRPQMPQYHPPPWDRLQHHPHVAIVGHRPEFVQ